MEELKSRHQNGVGGRRGEGDGRGMGDGEGGRRRGRWMGRGGGEERGIGMLEGGEEVDALSEVKSVGFSRLNLLYM